MLKFLPLLAFVSGAVHAAPSTNPEFLHQAPAGVLELTPTLSYQQAKAKYKSAGSADVKGFREAVRFEGGLSEMFSAGLELAANSTKTDFSDDSKKDPTASGLEDLVVFFHGRSDMTGSSLRYGLDVNFGLDKEKIESNGDSNNSSGGIGLTPFVGFETAVGEGTLGARLKYMFRVTKSKTEVTLSNGTNSYDTTGGAELSPAVFYEMPMAPTTLGVSLELKFKDKTKVEANGQSADRSASNTQWDLAVYVPVDVTPSIRILPQLTYGQYSAFDTAAVDSLDLWRLDVGARFVF